MLLAACSSSSSSLSTDASVLSTTAPTTAASIASTTAPAHTEGPTVQTVIDIGGGQAYGLSADSDSVWAVSFDAGTVAKIDPASETVTATVDLGSGAASAMSTADDLWVAGYGGAPLFRVDPASASTTDRFSVGELCCDLTYGNDLVWAIDPSGAVKGISPVDGNVGPQFDVTLDRNAHSNAVFAGGALWVSSDTTLLHRIDATTGVTEDLDVGGGVPFIAKDGLVWGASPTEVWAVDETTGEVAERITLEGSSEVLALDVGKSTVWVGVRRGRVGTVRELDRASGEVLAELDDVDIPARIVLAFDSAWVTDSGSSNVYRIGPAPLS
jgi:streptogramin lyase